MSFAVTVTVDVDGEAGLPGGRDESLTSRSERRYGLARGLERVLGVLAEARAVGTFYVPGIVARDHPDAIAAILGSDHELGHHGHEHLRPDAVPADVQRSELERGLAALSEAAGEAPAGYRAPGWAMTETTLELIGELGFSWDSSLMEDDRPYRIRTAAGTLWELPVQWTLDDAAWLAHPSDPSGMLAVWCAELAAARDEERHLTLTIHPEISGMAHRIEPLRHVLESLAGADVLPHRDVVARLSALVE